MDVKMIMSGSEVMIWSEAIIIYSVCDRGGLCSTPAEDIWHLWWTKKQWGRLRI